MSHCHQYAFAYSFGTPSLRPIQETVKEPSMYIFLAMFTMLTFVVVYFLFMFTKFGSYSFNHINLVILNWSREYSSFLNLIIFFCTLQIKGPETYLAVVFLFFAFCGQLIVMLSHLNRQIGETILFVFCPYCLCYFYWWVT